MSSLIYVGKNPDSDASITTKKFSDDLSLSLTVSTQFVNSTVAAKAQYLVSQTYVDNQDLLRAKKSAVDSADALYIPNTVIGQANGVATLDSSGKVTASQIPSGLSTERVLKTYNLAQHGTTILGSGSTQMVTRGPENFREFKIGSIPIPDPGYPWYPLCFGFAQGYSGGASLNPFDGTDNFGLLTVAPPSGVSDIQYAYCVGGASVHSNYYPIVPHAPGGVVPSTQPKINGGITLELNASCWSGNSYYWSGNNLTLQVIVMPAL